MSKPTTKYCPCGGKIILAFWQDEDGAHAKMQCDSSTMQCARVVEAASRGVIYGESDKQLAQRLMDREWEKLYGPFKKGSDGQSQNASQSDGEPSGVQAGG